MKLLNGAASPVHKEIHSVDFTPESRKKYFEPDLFNVPQTNYRAIIAFRADLFLKEIPPSGQVCRIFLGEVKIR